MATAPLTIWCNAAFPEPVMETFMAGLGEHALLMPPLLTSNLAAGEPDPLLHSADVAFGQPDPQQVIECTQLKWVHLTSAGYTRYDREEVRRALADRGGQLTTSSHVYAEPCAEHVFSYMLALARQFPEIVLEQKLPDGRHRAWRQAYHRNRCRLLAGQSAMIYGYGSIARRLTQLLQPFGMKLIGVRRKMGIDEGIMMIPIDQADAHLSQVDHVINILPSSPATDGYFNADRFRHMRDRATYYNIGRGTTHDQPALIAALKSGRLAAAYLDVTDPEPLPKDHPLWDAPNCWITPHTAGGHDREFERLAEHFLENLGRYERGEKMVDRVL